MGILSDSKPEKNQTLSTRDWQNCQICIRFLQGNISEEKKNFLKKINSSAYLHFKRKFFKPSAAFPQSCEKCILRVSENTIVNSE